MVKPHLYEKYKISQAWWWVPVIPATQEAEVGESLEPRRWRLQWGEIAPLHSSLGDRERLRLGKKKKKLRRTSIFLLFTLEDNWCCNSHSPWICPLLSSPYSDVLSSSLPCIPSSSSWGLSYHLQLEHVRSGLGLGLNQDTWHYLTPVLNRTKRFNYTYK